MKKRVLTMLLALVMVLGLCVPVLAAEGFEQEPVALAEEEAPVAPVEEEAAEPAPVEAEEPIAAAVDEPMTVAAASGTCGANGNNVTWSFSDDGTLTISGTGAMKDYAGLRSDGSKEMAPWRDGGYSSDIREVVIQNGVTTIGSWAFYGCECREVTIPDTVTRIGDNAFARCIYLNDVIIPQSVSYIGSGAFSLCISLYYITFAGSVSYIGDGAFSDCTRIKSIELPNGITTIEENTFLGCSRLESVIIPDTVTTIGRMAFNGCALKELTIPDSVTTIGVSAFLWCDMTSVTIPRSVTIIGSGAFSYCNEMAEVTILNPNTTIWDSAFGELWNVPDKRPMKNPRFLVLGYKGSTAEAYAKNEHLRFLEIGTDTTPPALEDIQPPAGGTGWRYVIQTGDYYYFKDGKRVGDYWVGFADGASAWANNWYYADADGKLLTGFQYLDDLKGGKAWYMLQVENDNGEIGKMLTGWQATYSVGLGKFSTSYGSQGMCTYNQDWGNYNAATGLWADGLSHKG